MDINKHRYYMMQVLLAIFRHPELYRLLGFKGGTAWRSDGLIFQKRFLEPSYGSVRHGAWSGFGQAWGLGLDPAVRRRWSRDGLVLCRTDQALDHHGTISRGKQD